MNKSRPNARTPLGLLLTLSAIAAGLALTLGAMALLGGSSRAESVAPPSVPAFSLPSALEPPHVPSSLSPQFALTPTLPAWVLDRLAQGAVIVAATDLSIAKHASSASGSGGFIYNGERITYTLVVSNRTGHDIKHLHIWDEFPRDEDGQVQIDNVECIRPCVLTGTTEVVLSPLGLPVSVTVHNRADWEWETDELVDPPEPALRANQSRTVTFSARASGLADGTTLRNAAYVFYERDDGQIGFYESPVIETVVRFRAESLGGLDLSDVPTWLSADLGGTVSLDWGDFDRDGDLDLALGSTAGATVYRNESGVLKRFWPSSGPCPTHTLGIRWADLDATSDSLELVLVGESTDNRAASPGTNYLLRLNASGTAFEEYDTFSSDYQLLRVEPGRFTPGDRVDLIATTNAISTVCATRLYTNTGGTIGTDYRCLSTAATADVAPGDMNNDGRLDLALGEFPNRVLVFRNTGGSLDTSNPIVVDVSTAFLPYDLSWGDYDGDGYLDLAAAYPLDGRVRVYRNEGGSGFASTAIELRTDAFYTPLGITWGDFDRNGHLDLAVSDKPPRIFLNTGVPGNPFGTALVLSKESAPGQIWAASAADADGDGDLELSLGHRDGASLLFTSFAPALSTQLRAVNGLAQASSVAWGDVDDNGYLDLLFGGGLTEASARAWLYLNQDGEFSLSQQSTAYNPGAHVAFGDVNADFELDAAVGTLTYLRYYTDTKLTEPPWQVDAPAPVRSLAWGDVEGDGDLDLLVGWEGRNALYVNAHNLGAGALLAATPAWQSPESDDTYAVAWGDYNSDGYLDIAVANEGRNRVYQNLGDKTFRLVWTSSRSDSTRSIAWADFSRDGRLDLAIGNYGAENWVCENVGNSFACTVLPGSDVYSKTTSLAWGDWDNDGDPDLAVGNDGEPNQVYGNLESSPGLPRLVWLWTSQDAARTTDVAWGDRDRDGDLDLAVSGEANGVYENSNAAPAHLLWPSPTPAMPLPHSSPYLAISRPGETPDAYGFSSAELLTHVVAIDYEVFGADRTGSGIKVISTTYEYSLDGVTWEVAKEAEPPTTALMASLLGVKEVFKWDAGADIGISDNAYFRIGVSDAPIYGPVQRATSYAVSPPFRVRATSCIWPESPAIGYRIVDPVGGTPGPDPGEKLEFSGTVLRGTGQLTYTWDFGDGTTRQGQRVQHTFTNNGSYLVRMGVTSVPCPEEPRTVTASVQIRVGTGASDVYLPLVYRNYKPSSAASAAAGVVEGTSSVTQDGTASWDDDAAPEPVPGGEPLSPAEAPGTQLFVHHLGVSLQGGAGGVETAATRVSLVQTGVLASPPAEGPLTETAPGVHAEPAISGDGNTVAFWSTGDMGEGSSTFRYSTIAPVLLVDDDDDRPDVRAYYQSLLDAALYQYDLFDTRNSDREPTAADLAARQVVIWFSGDEWRRRAAGPGASGEAALGEFLLGATGDYPRCLFLSSQDYIYSHGLTAFAREVLGADAVVQDGKYTWVQGVPGSAFESAPLPLSFSLDNGYIENWADWVSPSGDATAAFYGSYDASVGNVAGVYRVATSQHYRTLFLAFPFEAMAPALRENTMGRFLSMCGARQSVPRVVINEIAPNAIEFYNHGTQLVELGGMSYKIQLPSGVITDEFEAGATLPAGGYITRPVSVDWATAIDGSAALYDAHDLGVDFVRWGESDTLPPTGTHWDSPVGANPSAPALGTDSLQRADDTHAASDWCEREPSLGGRNYGCAGGFANPDGNIEAFVAEVQPSGGVSYTQISSSTGTILGGFNLGPVVNDDGSRVAFFSDQDAAGENADGNFEIFLYDAPRASLFAVTVSEGGVNIYPSIDHSGTRVAFLSDRSLGGGENSDRNLEVVVATVSRSGNAGFTQVTSSTAQIVNAQPAISGNGERVAYISDEDGSFEVFVAEIDASGTYTVRQVTDSETDSLAPSLTYTGTRLAFLRDGDVWLVDVDADLNVGEPFTITSGGGNSQPVISADGARVVYVHAQELRFHITNDPTSGYYRLPPVGPDAPLHPSLSANGEYVVYAAGGEIYRSALRPIDISVEKSVDVLRPNQDDIITYTIGVRNTGLIALTGILVTDTLPSGTSYQSSSPGGAYNAGTGVWQAGDLDLGEAATLTIQVKVTASAGSIITNQATGGVAGDARPGNNTDTADFVVNYPPIAGPDLFTTTQGVALMTTDVLTNDIDPDDDDWVPTLVSYTEPTSGSLTYEGDGIFGYDPEHDFDYLAQGETDDAVWTYTIVDDDGGEGVGTVTVSVEGLNDAPIAYDDSYTTNEDTVLEVTLEAKRVLYNDRDIDQTDTLTAALVTGPATGDLAFAVDGSFVYTPAAEFSGDVTFTYRTHDGELPSNIATVTITVLSVNDPPELQLGQGQNVNTTAAYAEDDPPVLLADKGKLTDRDKDEELVRLTVTIANLQDGAEEVLAATPSGGLTVVAVGGVLTISGNASPAVYQNALQTVTYQNASQDPTEGERYVQFVADDGEALSNVAVCTVTVSAANDPPVTIVPGAQTVVSNTLLVFSEANGNAVAVSDVDAGDGSISVTLTAISGTITLSGTTGLTFSEGDGISDTLTSFTASLANANAALDGMAFEPALNYVGPAELAIRANDQGNSGGPAEDSGTSTVSITVVAASVGASTLRAISTGAAVLFAVTWGATWAECAHVQRRRRGGKTQ